MVKLKVWRLRSLMALVALTAVGLSTYVNRPVRESKAARQLRLDGPIWKRLDQTFTLPHQDGNTLDTLLAQLKPLGLPIYVDPVGREDAGVTSTTILKIDRSSGSAKEVLESALKPIGLKFFVRDGLITITSSDEVEAAAQAAAKKAH